MFCKYCGNVLTEDAVFCSKCGKRVCSHTHNGGSISIEKETDTEKAADEGCKAIIENHCREENPQSASETNVVQAHGKNKLKKFLQIVTVIVLSAIFVETVIVFEFINHQKKKEEAKPPVPTEFSGYTRLMAAAEYGFTFEMKVLLLLGSNVNAEDSHKNAALSYALWHCENAKKQEKAVRILCNAGANLDGALSNAIMGFHFYENRKLNLVKILVEAGANVNDYDALDWAVRRKYQDIVQYLLDNGADADIPLIVSTTQTLRTVLYNAETVGIAQLLINAGANVNNRDRCGETPLMEASWQGRLEIVKLLLEHGADIHVKDNDGRTALMYAAWNGGVEVVKFLLEHGANVYTKDNYGMTALIRATKSTMKETEKEKVVELLRSYGAK